MFFYLPMHFSFLKSGESPIDVLDRKRKEMQNKIQTVSENQTGDPFVK